MVLFKESLSQWTPERKDGKQNAQGKNNLTSVAIPSSRNLASTSAVLPQDIVEQAIRLLVLRFIPLKPADLEGWETDPEDWVNHEEQDNDMWEYEIRVSLVSAGHVTLLMNWADYTILIALRRTRLDGHYAPISLLCCSVAIQRLQRSRL